MSDDVMWWFLFSLGCCCYTLFGMFALLFNVDDTEEEVLFKKPDAESISAQMNKARHEFNRGVEARSGVTYHSNGDVTRFVETKVFDMGATEVQALGDGNYTRAIQGFTLATNKTATALPYKPDVVEVVEALEAQAPGLLRRT